MSTILAIETSGKYCSVALIHEGLAEFTREEKEEMNHARAIGPFVEECVKEARRREWKIDAVAVSMGPGSYTGLRIGLSMAKGLCFSLNVPLIGVSTLKLIAVKAMFRNIEWQGDEILVPMIDARRMEVYTAAYDFRLDALMDPQPLILTEECYSELPKDRSIYFMGDGSGKSKELLKGEGRYWIEGVNPRASDMTALAEKAFREEDFIDVAYSGPEYLKEYEAKK
ncbi:MAG: tRNA (adenosine(37)-N6)-threonylcarbamoyltransferase complex dimerization subunit type 1 TsaB, partial [Muribaculaceae bacterium]|nr:tRNA (adenosine(37)-N6)-threonylcarbamoyltransferase complex dimerization subunit type 1 TsaB [Muribaculaceae bacterium]